MRRSRSDRLRPGRVDVSRPPARVRGLIGPLTFRLGMQPDVFDDLIEQVVNSVGTWRPEHFHK
ncbi:MAG: hypothetical protein ABW000_18875 [Actinoplanes sp.]